MYSMLSSSSKIVAFLSRSSLFLIFSGMASIFGILLWTGLFFLRWLQGLVAIKNLEVINRMFVEYFGADTKRGIEANAREVYRRHYRSIREAAKLEGRRILELKLSEGVGPLCKFLGKEVPEDVTLPRENEGLGVRKIVLRAQWILIGMAVGKLALLVMASIIVPGTSCCNWSSCSETSFNCLFDKSRR